MPFTGDHIICISTFKAQVTELWLFEEQSGKPCSEAIPPQLFQFLDD